MKINKTYAAVILFLGLAISLFGSSLVPSSSKMLSAGDIKHIYYPYREFLKASLSNHEIPFWNPYLFSGTPFLSHPYTEFFYPTTLLMLFLPSNLYFSINIALHIFLAGIFMFFLLKKFTDDLSALAGGIIYAFNGYFISRVNAGHLDYIISSSLWPLIFLFLYEYINNGKKSSLFWGTLIMCFQIFTGLLNFTFFILITAFIFFIVSSKWNKSKLTTLIKRFTLFSIISIGLSAIYLIPSYQFVSNTIRGQGLPYPQASYGSANLQTLILFINPHAFMSDLNIPESYKGAPPDAVSHTYFLGITTLAIVLGGIILLLIRHFDTKKITSFDSRIAALIIISLISIIISFGPNFFINVHYWLWKLFPLYRTTRLPVRHLIIVTFTTPLLVGLILKDLKNQVIKIALVVMITFELFTFGRKYIYLSNIPDLIPKSDEKLVQLLNNQEIIRVLPDFNLGSWLREDISFASPIVYRYFSTSGYTPAILANYYDFIDRINGNTSSSIAYFNSEIPLLNPSVPGIKFLNVKYIISDKFWNLVGNNNNPFKVITQGSNYIVYQNENYFPRFYFVPSAKVYPEIQSLSDNIYSDQNQYDKQISITSADSKKIIYNPDCQFSDVAQIRLNKYALNEVILELDAPCNGFISASETSYPDWEVQIDGKKSNLINSNLAFKAVNVPKGQHTIKLFYNPRIYLFSGIISVGFFLFAFLSTIFSDKRQQS
ncbi:hypothetical protein A2Y99_03875 [Candidatus Gottesmanbacteria bacterium RBG_13_37_7]|uniref:Membrane protein 6-pyruvoyl-tetrahydropterin synthase-related domain-containing protein n=1 Tax=Candidatus Gottesmanbacteria bacterium RBG_13_37_7 TaxID=1798369 RepID=A0A1F5YH78_9BACT|nr:MAG: hypothetical protein A2Y99_03875 [Candidatus Gottesmanbacteria bacterium RBG_13_37_7]